MKASTKVLIGLGLGVVTGGIAGFLLGTDKGRKIRKDAGEKLGKIQANVSETVRENKHVITEKFADTTDKAKSWANEVTEAAKEKFSDLTQTADNYENSLKENFQSGANKARKVMEEKIEMVSDVVDSKKA